MKRKVLILDRSYQVIDIMPFHKALGKWGRSLIDPQYDVQVISTFDDMTLKIHGEEIHPPSILRFNYLQNTKKDKKARQQFGRRNVWMRDNKECQFCGTTLSLKDMHWDHILPKSAGGKTSWLNIVCCCKKCNDIKADKLLSDCGLKLRSKPSIPLSCKTIYQSRIARLRRNLKTVPDESWLMFIQHILEKGDVRKI